MRPWPGRTRPGAQVVRAPPPFVHHFQLNQVDVPACCVLGRFGSVAGNQRCPFRAGRGRCASAEPARSGGVGRSTRGGTPRRCVKAVCGRCASVVCRDGASQWVCAEDAAMKRSPKWPVAQSVPWRNTWRKRIHTVWVGRRLGGSRWSKMRSGALHDCAHCLALWSPLFDTAGCTHFIHKPGLQSSPWYEEDLHGFDNTCRSHLGQGQPEVGPDLV
jgi:5-methylcytosine-specific restriction endonuclease McrA